MKLFAKLSTLFLAAALFLTGCGTSITGLTLDLPQTMERGSTLSATPEYAYSGDTPEAARAEELADKLDLSWTSSDPSVVTVDGARNLTAVKPGTAEVALSSGDGKLTASSVIRVVVSPTGLTLPQTLTLTEGGEPQSAAAVVEPADATDYIVNYRSSDDSIVTVDAAGTVTPVAAGEALVTAEIPGKGLAATCHVVVKPALKALHLSEDALTLSTGKTESLTLTAEPEEAELAGVVWSSSDEAVATVDGDGTVTAVAEGKATVTASVDGVEASCAVTVRAPAPAAGSGSGSSSGSGSGGSSAPAASTSYGAVPFSDAAGSLMWWGIDSTDDVFWATLNNINAYRAAVGVAPLSIDSGLTAIADQRCCDMVVAGVMSHDGYQTPEIIAQNWNSAQSVVDAWAGSPGHYAAMTDPSYTVCGIGCWFEEGGATYWCVTFG